MRNERVNRTKQETSVFMSSMMVLMGQKIHVVGGMR